MTQSIFIKFIEKILWINVYNNINNKLIKNNSLFGIYNNNLNQLSISTINIINSTFNNNINIFSIIKDQTINNTYNNYYDNNINFINVKFLNNLQTWIYHKYPDDQIQ